MIRPGVRLKYNISDKIRQIFPGALYLKLGIFEKIYRVKW
mgnify:CR=1 FL=1